MATTKKSTKKSVVRKPKATYSLREYINKKVDGYTLSKLAKESGISYPTIQRHVDGYDMRVATARKIQEWSKGRITVAKIMTEETA